MTACSLHHVLPGPAGRRPGHQAVHHLCCCAALQPPSDTRAGLCPCVPPAACADQQHHQQWSTNGTACTLPAVLLKVDLAWGYMTGHTWMAAKACSRRHTLKEAPHSCLVAFWRYVRCTTAECMPCRVLSEE